MSFRSRTGTTCGVDCACTATATQKEARTIAISLIRALKTNTSPQAKDFDRCAAREGRYCELREIESCPPRQTADGQPIELRAQGRIPLRYYQEPSIRSDDPYCDAEK